MCRIAKILSPGFTRVPDILWEKRAVKSGRGSKADERGGRVRTRCFGDNQSVLDAKQVFAEFFPRLG